jgi:hypothetical protein
VTDQSGLTIPPDQLEFDIYTNPRRRLSCQGKAAYPPIPFPPTKGFCPTADMLEQTWANMLGQQLPVLPPLNDFWDALPEIFSWMTGAAEIAQRGFISHDPGETPVISRVLPLYIPIRSRSIFRSARDPQRLRRASLLSSRSHERRDRDFTGLHAAIPRAN